MSGPVLFMIGFCACAALLLWLVWRDLNSNIDK